MEIPKDHFVVKVDLDCDEPFCLICPNDDAGRPQAKLEKVLIPKSLAFYLSTHFCGSERMRSVIREGTRREIVNGIKVLLGF